MPTAEKMQKKKIRDFLQQLGIGLLMPLLMLLIKFLRVLNIFIELLKLHYLNMIWVK